MASAPDYVAQRVMAKVRPDGDCIISLYSINSGGYAQVGWKENGVSRLARCHRVVWEAVNGPIPGDLTIDHLCRVRNCINVEHLRLLTNLENAADNAWATRARTHCPKGHPYVEGNFYFLNDGRWKRCRTCRIEDERSRRAARRLDNADKRAEYEVVVTAIRRD